MSTQDLILYPALQFNLWCLRLTGEPSENGCGVAGVCPHGRPHGAARVGRTTHFLRKLRLDSYPAPLDAPLVATAVFRLASMVIVFVMPVVMPVMTLTCLPLMRAEFPRIQAVPVDVRSQVDSVTQIDAQVQCLREVPLHTHLLAADER